AIESDRTEKEEQIDSLTKEQVEQRTVDIYDTRNKIEGKYYRDEVLAQGVVLSSDGWIVAYRPDYRSGSYRSWEAVDHRGVVHEIEKSLYDPQSGMLYLYLGGDNFRVSGIADWDDLDPADALWTVADWKRFVLDEKQKTGSREVYNLKEPIYSFKLPVDKKDASVVVNSSGELVGFLGENGRVVPSWYVSAHMDDVLGGEELSYDFPDTQGIIINRFSREDNRTETKTGFYITQTKSDQLKRGDIIIEINGKPIKTKDLARQIIGSSLPINLKVISQEGTKQIKITN
ncbi:MAG: hypothetical protein ABEJ02_00275, partial [Candidatus Paceibacteria bacterium]